MRLEDLYIRLLVAILLMGFLIAIMPWWLWTLLLVLFLYGAGRLWWKFHKIKKMMNEGGNPFQGQQGNPFGGFGGFSGTQSNGSQSTSSRQSTTQSSSSASKKKVIGDDEGDYVEYEEVKE